MGNELIELARNFNALRGIPNIVSITADVHYAAAHWFPANDWFEFVAGPIHAESFGPNPLDPTFSPEVHFQWAPQPGHANLAPWDGLQLFGTIDVARDQLTVKIWGIDNRERYSVEIASRQ